MQEKTLKEEVDLIIVERRVKLLGIVIVVGIIAVFAIGLLLPSPVGDSALKETPMDTMGILNIVTLFIAVTLCPISVAVKNSMLRKLNYGNMPDRFFNAHIIAFAICDFGALICIATNLFVNRNVTFATMGLIVSLVCMYLLFPKERKM